MNNTTDETPIRANMVKFKLGIDDYIRNINRPKDIGVICFEHVNGLTTENNHTNGFCTYKLNDRPSDQIPIYVFAFNQEDIGKSMVFRVMVRNTADGFEYVDRDATHIYAEAVMNPLISKHVITQCLL